MYIESKARTFNQSSCKLSSLRDININVLIQVASFEKNASILCVRTNIIHRTIPRSLSICSLDPLSTASAFTFWPSHFLISLYQFWNNHHEISTQLYWGWGFSFLQRCEQHPNDYSVGSALLGTWGCRKGWLWEHYRKGRSCRYIIDEY